MLHVHVLYYSLYITFVFSKDEKFSGLFITELHASISLEQSKQVITYTHIYTVHT